MTNPTRSSSQSERKIAQNKIILPCELSKVETDTREIFKTASFNESIGSVETVTFFASVGAVDLYDQKLRVGLTKDQIVDLSCTDNSCYIQYDGKYTMVEFYETDRQRLSERDAIVVSRGLQHKLGLPPGTWVEIAIVPHPDS